MCYINRILIHCLWTDTVVIVVVLVDIEIMARFYFVYIETLD